MLPQCTPQAEERERFAADVIPRFDSLGKRDGATWSVDTISGRRL